MAKNGIISAQADNDSGEGNACAELAQSEPRISTLGSLVTDALRTVVSGNALAFIDTANRKVFVAKDTAAVREALDGIELAGKGEVTKDDAAAASSPMTLTNDTGTIVPLTNAFATRKPNFSPTSMLNAIEDALMELGKDAIIVVDQANAKVIVHHDTTANVAAAGEVLDDTSLGAELDPASDLIVKFVQSVTEAGGTRPFGE